MRWLELTYAVLGSAAVVLAVVSRRLRSLPVSESLVALALGALAGPHVLGLVEVDADVRDPLLLEVSRVLLAASVMAAALRFPVRTLRPLVRPLLLLIAVAMPLAALTTGAAALALGLPLGLALLLGACLSPTDPVLAAAVVSGEPAERTLPERLRALLTAESGANDGLALPLVAAVLVATVGSETPSSAAGRLAWEVGGGVLLGSVLGVVGAALITWADRKEQMSDGPRLIYTLLLTLAVLGVARLAQTDGVLAVFVAGLAYNVRASDMVRGRQEEIDEAVNRYAVLPFFALLGVVLPWAEWRAMGWSALALVAAALLARRPVWLLLLRRPLGLARRDAVFAGWFGPMGVSAVFYLAHSAESGVTDPRLFTWGTLAVAASVVAYGLTASPGVSVYDRRS